MGFGSLLAGVALIAYALATGSAHLFLFLIFPVVTGGSLQFALGVVLLIAGFVLSFATGAGEQLEGEATGPEGRGTAPTPSSEGFGVVLIGPIPLFFGGWKNRPRGVTIAWVIAGCALTVMAIALVLGLRV
ncbi:MAG: DUF131 domain-containing protein [Thermoplasmata archaeon]|nr:DUF131 domain-containing protein [Thermoplasmata archaeon]